MSWLKAYNEAFCGFNAYRFNEDAIVLSRVKFLKDFKITGCLPRKHFQTFHKFLLGVSKEQTELDHPFYFTAEGGKIIATCSNYSFYPKDLIFEGGTHGFQKSWLPCYPLWDFLCHTYWIELEYGFFNECLKKLKNKKGGWK